MNTTMKPDTESEPRPLQEHELEHVSGGASSGIERLISVAQQKNDDANKDALDGATKQKS